MWTRAPGSAPPRPGHCSSRRRVAARRSAKRPAGELRALADSGDRIRVGVRDGDSRAAALYQARYSHRLFGRQRKSGRRFIGPGDKIVLLTPDAGALFVWRRSIEPGQSSPRGIYCSIFRREPGNRLASEMILDAETKPKPKWDVYLPGDGNRCGSLAGVSRPLIAGQYGSAVSPRLSGWTARPGICRPSPAPLPCFPGRDCLSPPLSPNPRPPHRR